MSAEREKEFEELLAFLDFYATNVRSIDPANPVHVTTAVGRIVEQFGKSKALEGLRQAINDTVEDLSDLSSEQIALLDGALRSKGILTFSEIRHRYASSYKRILRRGSIKTDTEYYLINGIVVDTTSSVTSSDRQSLEQMLSAYENRGSQETPSK